MGMKLFPLVVLFLVLSLSVSALDFGPNANVNLRGIYNVTNASFLCIGADCRNSWPTSGGGGGGVITVQNTDGRLVVTNGTTATINFNVSGNQDFNDSASIVNSFTSSNGSIGWTVSGAQSRDAIVNLSWLDNMCVLQNEYPSLDTNSANDLTTATNFGGDVSGQYSSIEIGQDTIGDIELNYSKVTLADFTNDVGFITTYAETDPLWSSNQTLVYLKTNEFGFYNSSTIPVYVSVESDPLFRGNKSTICFTNGTGCPAGSTDTIWAINESELSNSSNVLGVNRGFLDTRAALAVQNTTIVRAGSAACGGTDQIHNITLNASGIFISCSAQGSGGGMSSWVLSNGSTTETITDSERINITAGRNVSITQVGGQVVINSADTDTDTIWGINSTDLLNRSGVLGINYTTLNGQYYPKTDNPLQYYNSSNIPAYLLSETDPTFSSNTSSICWSNGTNCLPDDAYNASYLTAESDPLYKGNSTSICFTNGTNCPAGSVDTIWNINSTDLLNRSNLLGINYTTIDSLYVGQSEYPNLDTDGTNDLTISGFAASNITSGSVGTTFTDAKDTTDDSVSGTVDSAEITNGVIMAVDLNLTDITLNDFSNDASFLTAESDPLFKSNTSLICWANGTNCQPDDAYNASYLTTESDPLYKGNTSSICWSNGTNCPVGSTDTIWSINTTDLINRSNILGLNYTTIESLYVGQNEYANLDTDSTNDLTTATSWTGDLSGTGSNPQVVDNSLTLQWDNVTSKPANLDTDSTNDLTIAGFKASNITDYLSTACNPTSQRLYNVTLSGGLLTSTCGTDEAGGTVGAGNLSIIQVWSGANNGQLINNSVLNFTTATNSNITLSLSGTVLTVSHADTSGQATSDNSARTYIQDIQVDGNGHITGIATATETVTDTNNGGNMSMWSVSSNGVTSSVLNATTLTFANTTTGNISLSLSGTTLTIAHVDTSAQANSDNSARTYIQDILFDGHGHVTGVATATETVTDTDTNSGNFTHLRIREDTTAAYQLVNNSLISLISGTGISVTSSDSNFTFTNTGDTDASDDPSIAALAVQNVTILRNSTESNWSTIRINVSSVPTIRGNNTCTIIYSPAGTGRLEVCD